MIGQTLAVIAMIGAGFGAIAALMAFLIVFGEYSKHGLSPGRVWREALGAAAAAFLVFFGGAVIVGLILGRR